MKVKRGGRARRRSSEEENGRGGLEWGKSEREDRILSSEVREWNWERIEKKNERGWRREEHPSRVQLRNGFGFVAAFWIKVREETIAVRSSLSISFSSFFFHWHSLSSYPLIIHVGVSEGTGEVILLAWMSHVFAKSVNYCSAEADFFERKKLEMTSFLRFRDGTESECLWVSECVLEWVSEGVREDRL